MSNYIEYENLIGFHPGSYVEDIIDDLNISQNEFAERLGTSSKTVSELVNGLCNISPDLAYKLEQLTSISFDMWMNLQNAYDKKKAEIEARVVSDEDEVVDKIDLKYFKVHGLIEDKKYFREEKKEVLRSKLNVANLLYFKKFNSQVSYRNKYAFSDESIINSNVMLELAENISRNKTDTKLNINKLKSSYEEIKRLILKDYDEFLPALKDILLDCGIVLVALPHLRNSGLNGACKKFKNGSVLLLITDRNKRADIFWFSLLHELGHIVKKDFYTNELDIKEYESKERIANDFAADFLIDKEGYRNFVEGGDFSIDAIEKFAEAENVLTCILTGRLKNDGLIDHKAYNSYNTYYEISLDNDEVKSA